MWFNCYPSLGFWLTPPQYSGEYPPLSLGRLEFDSQQGGVLNVLGGFPSSSAGKESACNAGDPGSIPGSGKSAGERIVYPLQYFWAFQVA